MKKMIWVFTALMLLGCGSDGGRERIDLPVTDILETRDLYAVVAPTHVRLLEKPDLNASIVKTVWKNQGLILEIISRSVLGEEESQQVWYKIQHQSQNGWVRDSEILIYNDYEDAKEAVR